MYTTDRKAYWPPAVWLHTCLFFCEKNFRQPGGLLFYLLKNSINISAYFIYCPGWTSFYCYPCPFPRSLIISIAFHCHYKPGSPFMNKPYMSNPTQITKVYTKHISFLRNCFIQAIPYIYYPFSREISRRPSGSWIFDPINGICPGYKRSTPGGSWRQIYRAEV